MILKITSMNSSISIEGDASLWKDDLRIYEIKDISLSITEDNI